jgi:hypothetical protein
LRDQGFERHQFEVPITTPLGDLRADALLYQLDPNLILLGEGKSGRNIDADQAQKYLAADVSSLARTGVIPPPLRRASAVSVRTLFVGREEHRGDLERSLRHLGINTPLLTVGPTRVRLSSSSGTPGLDDFDVQHSGGLPPGRLPMDYQSEDQDILEVLLPQVVARQARREDIVSLESLAASTVPEWPVLSHGARQAFLSRIAALLRRVAANEMRGQFVFEPVVEPDSRGRIKILTTPAMRDPRGRTRAWQAQQTRAEAALRRRGPRPIPGQLSLDQLADEGGLADE